jgi:hypothetical protein
LKHGVIFNVRVNGGKREIALGNSRCVVRAVRGRETTSIYSTPICRSSGRRGKQLAVVIVMVRNPYRYFFQSKAFPLLMGIVQTQNRLRRLESIEFPNTQDCGMMIVLRTRLCGMYKEAKYYGIKCNTWQRVLVDELVVELEKEENDES